MKMKVKFMLKLHTQTNIPTQISVNFLYFKIKSKLEIKSISIKLQTKYQRVLNVFIEHGTQQEYIT